MSATAASLFKTNSNKDLKSPTSTNSVKITSTQSSSLASFKKPLITPSLLLPTAPSSVLSSALSSSALSTLTSIPIQSALKQQPSTLENINYEKTTFQETITSLSLNNMSSKINQAQNQQTAHLILPTYSVNQIGGNIVSASATVANSTGTASSILNSLSAMNTSNTLVNNNINNNNNLPSTTSTSLSNFNDFKSEDKENNNNKINNDKTKNKIEDLDFLTTVGTGTFGRVMVVRHKTTKEYFALKIMSISEVLRLKQTEHVKNEKDILTQAKHPFIIHLYWTSHSERFLYMLLEYVCGGELFSYLRNAVKFSNEAANFYATEIVSALEYLHSLSIIYRDLKPENLLIDRQGHIKICDFGFAKKVHDRTWTLCGTPEYLAPEIIVGKGHHKAVDWWALGILVYEMLAGYPPFYDENPFQIYQKILAGKIEWPRNIDLVAKDLIKKLLVNDRTKRLGTMKNGPEDIKRHKWFRNIDWESVAQRKLQPPMIPKIVSDGDTKNFDKYDEDGWRDVPVVSAKSFQAFEDF